MTNEELNSYILHYLTKDKTNSAIMLTGDWGTGKSYYIQHSLKPFLEKDENGKHSCVIVSLYGLKDTAEISKGIYLGTRLKILNTVSESAATAKFAGRTIVKGLAGFFGVDLSQDEKSLLKLYESVDLTGKLIVLEDLERSGIDILEVLGYVNNLVEQDGVKVLLVANEDEIIKFEFGNRIIGQQEKKALEEEQSLREVFELSTENRDRIIQCRSSEDYLRAKEKTISDTIQFEEDWQTTIQEIIQMFDNETLDKFSDAESVKDILTIMLHCKSYNLRSFIFACQKTSDVFNSLDEKYLSDEDFIQAIFFGVLFFVLRQKNGKTYKWGEEKYFSLELGHEKAPLFKFCYDYITTQRKQFDDVENAYRAFSELVLYDMTRSDADQDIATLRRYYIQTENDVISALANIEKRLENPEDISFYQYGTIAVYAIIVKGILGYNIDTIKSRLVANLHGKGHKLELEQIFWTISSDACTPEQKKEYEMLRKEMAESLKLGNEIIPNFDYQPEQSKEFNNYVTKNCGHFHLQESFAAQLDMKRISEMFRNSTAQQKDQIRGTFIEMYRAVNIKSSLASDKESIAQLLEFVRSDQTGEVGDAIQRLQYEWFIENLEEIVRKLA